MTARDPYRILGVARGASREEVRRAYRKLVRKHHPDANPGDPQAEERFKELQQAYETLTDPRRQRERTRPQPGPRRTRTQPRSPRAGRAPGASSGLSDLLGDLSHGGSGGAAREVREEDVARVLGLFGLSPDRLKNLQKSMGKNGEIRFSFGNHFSREASPDENDPPRQRPNKPPKPPKPPRP